ncbi:peptidase family C50-domain-containing protein, partial [Thamnocephalis sphaerospora]
DDVEDILYYVLDAYMYHGVPVEFDEIDYDRVSYDSNATAVLLELRGLVSNWRQTAERLKAAAAQSAAEPQLILMLDKSTQSFPWESLPILRARAVARLPSWTLLRDQLLANTSTTLQPARTSFVLNPGGDLAHTQTLLGPMLKRMGWQGIVGRAPLEPELRTRLQTDDTVLYFGHGGAEQYIRGGAVRKLDRCAVTLLMGCSSGHLAPAGEFEPTGTALNYLMAGCPAVVANLWDVTDKDIDRFSLAMLDRWGLLPASAGVRTSATRCATRGTLPSLASAVAASRDACTLPYLVGAAPVVYGLPHMTMLPSRRPV